MRTPRRRSSRIRPWLGAFALAWSALGLLSGPAPVGAGDAFSGEPPAGEARVREEAVTRHDPSGFGILSSSATTTYPTLAPTISTRESERREARRREQLDFVRANRERVVEEMAEGAGSHISALAELLGCPWAYREDFYRLAQTRYAVIVPDADPAPERLLERLRAAIGEDDTLEAVCRWA